MGFHFVTPYGRGAGSARVRVYDWLDRIDVATTVHDYLGLAAADPNALVRRPGRLAAAEGRLRRLARAPLGHLVLHREASPLSRGGLEESLLRRAEFAVYDFDDALQWDTGGGPARRLFPKPRKCRIAVCRADRVIAGSDVLAEWASDHARDVVVIPSCVDPSAYSPKTDHRLSDPPRLGWMGSPSTERFLRMLEPALLELHRRTGVRLTVVSAGSATLGRLDPIVDRVPWSADSFGRMLSAVDVAVAPLANERFARGKCAYKVLQYAACGLPIVGSPVGANEQALRRLSGVAVNGTQEWIDAVTGLLETSTQERAAIGRAARHAVERFYSFGAWEGAWRAAVGMPKAAVTSATRVSVVASVASATA